MQPLLGHPQSTLPYELWLPFVFGITAVGGPRKLRRGHWAICGWLLLVLFLQTACSGGSNSNGGEGTQGPTNYTVTISGTSGVLQHTTQVTLTVQ